MKPVCPPRTARAREPAHIATGANSRSSRLRAPAAKDTAPRPCRHVPELGTRPAFLGRDATRSAVRRRSCPPGESPRALWQAGRGRRRSPKRKGNPVQGACVCLWVLTSMTERPPCTRHCGRWLPCVMRVTASASNPNCPFGAVPTRGQATSPKPGAARRPPRGVLVRADCREPPACLASPLQSPARRTRPRGGGQRRRSLTVRFSVKEGAHLARRVSLRPHHPERARSRLISETTQSLAWLAPGWEATQEDRVL